MSKRPKAKAPAVAEDLAVPKRIRKNHPLPSSSHVARHVPWTRLRRDADDNVLGLLPRAFELRPEEPALSVNWLEYFSGSRRDQLQAIAQDIRAKRTIGPQSAFGIGNVGELESQCKDLGIPVNVVYWPTKGNLSHSRIQDTKNDLDLLALIAEEVFTDFVQNKDIP